MRNEFVGRYFVPLLTYANSKLLNKIIATGIEYWRENRISEKE
jgi:hypothetical protein